MDKKVLIRINIIGIGLLISYLGTGPVFAEKIELKNGSVITGKIVERTQDHIKVDTGVGVNVTYYTDSVLKIIEEQPASVIPANKTQESPADTKDIPVNSKEIFQQVESSFLSNDFKRLDQWAAHYRLNKARTENGDWCLSLFYDALTFDGVGSWEEYFEKFAKWMSERPASITPYVAKANALLDYAWEARGGGWAREVSAEGLDLFRKRVKQAEEVLQQAKSSGKDRDCPGWYAAMQTVALTQSWPKSQYMELFTQASQKYPLYTPLYKATVRYLLPRWFGIEGDAERFMENATAALSEHESATLYAQMAEIYLETYSQEAFSQSRISWERIKKGYEYLINDYPESYDLINRFAYFASLANDRETALRVFNNAKVNPAHLVWICDPYGFYAWQDWAQSTTENWPLKTDLGKDQARDGDWVENYSSGEKKVSAHYSQGVLDDLYQDFYSNQQLKSKGFYLNGQKFGPWKEYYESGELHFEGTYIDGDLKDQAKYYYKNGALQPKEVYALEQAFQMASNRDAVAMRSNIDIYIDLINAYYADNQLDLATPLLKEAIKVNPLNTKLQLKMAAIESQEQKFNEAHTRLQFILKEEKDDSQVLTEAKALLEQIQPFLQDSPNLSLSASSDRILYLLPFEGASKEILQNIADNLVLEFKVKVKILDEPFKPLETTLRDSQDRFLQLWTRSIPNEADNPLLSNHEKENLIKEYILTQPDGANKWYWIQEQLKHQLDANVLMSQINESYIEILKDPTSLGIVAVTDKDIRIQTYNFVFGIAEIKDKLAVMSYYRFNENNISPDTLMARATKQAFSSTGLMMGLGRCTTPQCPRTYPNNLTEHDKKNLHLCNVCLTKLNEKHQNNWVLK